MQKKIIIVFLLVVLAVMVAITTGVVFAETAPFQPGDVLFPVQHYAEQQARFYHNINQNAAWYLIITERRAVDLAVQAGTTNQNIALQYLDEAVNVIAELLSHAPAGSIDLVSAQLTATLKQAKVVVAGLTPVSSEDAQYIAMVEAKISTFLMLVTNQDMAALKGIPHLLATMGNQNLDDQIDRYRTLIAPLVVPFPESSAGWNHAFYSLIGAHAAANCETCHMDGNYQGTPQACFLTTMLLRLLIVCFAIHTNCQLTTTLDSAQTATTQPPGHQQLSITAGSTTARPATRTKSQPTITRDSAQAATAQRPGNQQILITADLVIAQTATVRPHTTMQGFSVQHVTAPMPGGRRILITVALEIARPATIVQPTTMVDSARNVTALIIGSLTTVHRVIVLLATADTRLNSVQTAIIPAIGMTLMMMMTTSPMSPMNLMNLMKANYKFRPCTSLNEVVGAAQKK